MVSERVWTNNSLPFSYIFSLRRFLPDNPDQRVRGIRRSCVG